jgi:hypothetical protein
MANTEQQLRRELHDEREQLAEAVGTLRAKVSSRIPLVAGGALALGVARLLLRRGRAGNDKG